MSSESIADKSQRSWNSVSHLSPAASQAMLPRRPWLCTIDTPWLQEFFPQGSPCCLDGKGGWFCICKGTATMLHICEAATSRLLGISRKALVRNRAWLHGYTVSGRCHAVIRFVSRSRPRNRKGLSSRPYSRVHAAEIRGATSGPTRILNILHLKPSNNKARDR